MSDFNEFLPALERIQKLDGSDYGKMPTKNNILAGSFDVWSSEEDRLDSQRQAMFFLKRMKDAGWAINHPYRKDGSIEPNDCWFLTKKSKELLDNKCSKPESVWRNKYNSLAEYYHDKYDKEFYSFDEYQLQIDPDETVEDMQKYSVEKQIEEIEKCKKSFAYFCHKYIKISHPTRGIIPFINYKYHMKSFNAFEGFRFNIVSKFRQSGMSSLTLIYCFWKAMFGEKKDILFLSNNDRAAVDLGKMFDLIIRFMPEWMKPNKGIWNDHYKEFDSNKSTIQFSTPQACCGKYMDLLVIDEAAFITDMDLHWKAMWPILSAGGKAIVVSSTNPWDKGNNWFKEIYQNAEKGLNRFNVIDIDFWENPDWNPYENPQRIKDCLRDMGKDGFMHEILRCF